MTRLSALQAIACGDVDIPDPRSERSGVKEKVFQRLRSFVQRRLWVCHEAGPPRARYDRGMNARLRTSCALAICAGGFVLFSDAAQVVPVFPEHPPSSDVDPSSRHQIEVSMPARLSVQRTSSRLSVSYDLASVRNVKITVGKKMALGIRDELRVYVRGDARPPQPRSISLGSINEKESAVPFSDPNILKRTEVLRSVQDGIPAPGKQCVHYQLGTLAQRRDNRVATGSRSVFSTGARRGFANE
jgi:hypothetical protein